MVFGLNLTRKCTDMQQTEQSVTKNKNDLGFGLNLQSCMTCPLCNQCALDSKLLQTVTKCGYIALMIQC